MKTLKGATLPSIITLSIITIVLITMGYIWAPTGLCLIQLAGLIWVSNSEDPDEFVKESRKLWKKITSIF